MDRGALWIAACGLLTLPFVVLWSKNTKTRPWRFLMAVCVTIFPPVGLIGWVSPISFAGTVFPGLGWLGFGFALLLTMALVTPSRKFIVGLVVVGLVSNAIAVTRNTEPRINWLGIDTQFSELLSAERNDGMQFLMAMERVEWVKQFAETVPANSVRVLPETLLGPYSNIAKLSLTKTEAELSKRGSRVLVGAELENPEGGYLNSVIVLGAQKSEGRQVAQGIPVPVSMWKPWASNGAVADVWGHQGVIEVKDMRTGMLICYEQFLTFSILQTMMSEPHLLAGVSNVWWAHDSTFPLVQEQMMRGAREI